MNKIINSERIQNVKESRKQTLFKDHQPCRHVHLNVQSHLNIIKLKLMQARNTQREQTNIMLLFLISQLLLCINNIINHLMVLVECKCPCQTSTLTKRMYIINLMLFSIYLFYFFPKKASCGWVLQISVFATNTKHSASGRCA